MMAVSHVQRGAKQVPGREICVRPPETYKKVVPARGARRTPAELSAGVLYSSQLTPPRRYDGMAPGFARIQLYYDIISPYSYLAFEALTRYARTGAWNVELELCPVRCAPRRTGK